MGALSVLTVDPNDHMECYLKLIQILRDEAIKLWRVSTIYELCNQLNAAKCINIRLQWKSIGVNVWKHTKTGVQTQKLIEMRDSTPKRSTLNAHACNNY